MKKVLYLLLLLANGLVLAGVLWPENAPPFAPTVNVATLAANLVVFAVMLRGAMKKS
ncbi:MAG TPA: hypothetical protein VF384_14940 [Planctomycetota bacterium]